MNKYEERTLKKQTDIVTAALNLFGDQGFSNVSIKDIAALANVSQVSIYNYFGNKESLVTECAKVIMGDTIKLAEEILATDESFELKLERALSLCDKEINRSLSKYLSEQASNDGQFLTLLIQNINDLKKEIYMKYIAVGKEEQVISEAVSDEVIGLFIDAINTLGMSISEELKAKQSEVIHLFLYGLIG
ncbi:TetR family transcriptional regulator [Enterococcus sp. JM4C]|uniref:TetR/AcrR family transcriptional regulator n=1 Tax=Candidatus Enterococcus huntleyi TaxID=1857217 RepID=UPI00137B05F8|nr:TetR/AcrR family transcriptional regulator [Enterococcus sp. JM4C]KAF1297183.1 TetR family transcriptional regulator [Enterococcus sp. JM4C]